MTALGNFLGAQMFLHGKRVVGAAFDRRIIGDDHALHAFHCTDTGYNACGRDAIVITFPGRKLTDFEKRRTAIEQLFDALACEQLAAGKVAFLIFRSAALLDQVDLLIKIIDDFLHGFDIGKKGFVFWIN